ncbi:DsbA family protein [Kribbella sancticallisti]|uniref:DsbA family protein n=1 Tax=Kribbella sancticallisti TaxID=460087 RepID=UPI0031D4D442
MGIAVAFAVVVGVLLAVSGREQEEPAAAAGVSERMVRPDSHRLGTAADGKATFVEFLDFECEACRAAFPAVEQLRKDYAGRVTFVVRYFPLPGHFNAERAARAVEAASKQGKFEQMYQKMYATQAEWGEQQVPADDRFRGFAKELGLDMAAWEKAYNDPATLERIKKDAADGQALGVSGTPTFFLNGAKLEPESIEDLKASIDAALE